jgi:flagellar basal-body rod modification protein FlgD
MTTVTSPANTASTNTLLNQAAQSTSGVGADFNMFLKMLTVQMQNQDPLDPMDTSEYTKQLVQFSQVEQSMQQTGVLKDILTRVSGQDMAQASAFIGREARFDTNVTRPHCQFDDDQRHQRRRQGRS